MRTVRFCFYVLLLYTCTSSCSTNVLMLKYRRHFYEHDSVHSAPLVLEQDVQFNDPRIIDEEYTHSLEITFHDTAAAKRKKVLNLNKDTAIVTVSYENISVWNWFSNYNIVGGTIKILKWKQHKIVLEENLTARGYADRKVRYRGRKTFRGRNL